MKSSRNQQKTGSFSKRIGSKQRGGASSDYAQLFYAPSVDNAQLSRYTLQHINQAPMFNPLQARTIIPTGTSGIIPTGSFYDSITPVSSLNPILPGPPVALPGQLGGSTLSSKVYYITKSGKSLTNPWIAHVYQFADKHKISYNQAIKLPEVKATYKKVVKLN